MKTIIAVIALAAASIGASAATINPADYSCSQLRAIARTQAPNPIEVLVNGKAQLFYSDFFGQVNNCTSWQLSETGYVTDAQGGQCPVGFTCVDKTALGGLTN